MSLLPVNINSDQKFTDEIGDKIPLNKFIEDCKNGMFINYDGFASEVILNGNVISDETFLPSNLEEGVEKQLLDIQQKYGTVHVVWYNK